MKKAILIFPETGPYGRIIKDLPLSVLYASRVAYAKGYDIKIIDQRVEPNWQNVLLKELNETPLCVGISCMTGKPINYALELSKFVKENSEVQVVWGGIHPTLLPRQTLENKYIDAVIVGQGELTFYDLLKALEKDKSFKNIPGLFFKNKEGKIVGNKLRMLADLNQLPDVPYHLIDYKKYYRAGFKEKIFPILTSEGCPHRCAFCFTQTTWKAESPERVLRNLKFIMDTYKPDYILVNDNDFFIDIKRAKTIFEKIKEEKFDEEFGFRGTRVDDITRMDDDFLSLMSSINTKHLHIGAESGSQRILDFMQKGITVEQTIDINRKLKNFPSLLPSYNFFTGIPTEEEEDLYATTNLILKLLKENPYSQISSITQFTPYPGTKLFDIAVQYGYAPPKKLEDWAYMDPSDNAKNLQWVSKRQQRLLDTLYVTAIFIDNKVPNHFRSDKLLFRLLRFSSKMYRPIAKKRFENHITTFPLEISLVKQFLKYG